MGAALTTLTLGFKLNELDNDYKKNVVINYPTCSDATTDLQRAVDVDDVDRVAELCKRLLNPNPLRDTVSLGDTVDNTKPRAEISESHIPETDILDVTNALMICIMKDRQRCFDSCFAVYLQQFTTINAETTTSNKGEKNVVTDFIDDLTYTKTILTMHLSDIMQCCVWSMNLHYLQQVTDNLLKHMGIFSSFSFFWEPVAIAAKRNNINALNFLDSREIITQRLLLRAAYGAVSGENADCLRWIFNNDKKLPVLDCILNATVYVKWFTMFNELYQRRDTESKEYLFDAALSEIVLSDDAMFRENVSKNLFSSEYDQRVLDRCVELGLTSEMVRLITLPTKERVGPESRHIKYIYQFPEYFSVLVKTYPHDIIADVLCWVIDSKNADKIVKHATKKLGKLTDAHKLMLMSHTRDASFISDFLSSTELCLTDPSEGINAVTHDSNEILFDVLTSKYSLVLTSELLCTILRKCTYDLCLSAIKLTNSYDPANIIKDIIHRADNFTISEIEFLLNLILTNHPDPEFNQYDVWSLGKCQDINKIDLFISKIRSIGKEENLMNIVKYSCDDVAFYHICRKYLTSDDSMKKHLAEEMKYRIKDMLKGKEFNKLLFLVKELCVPIEFVVLKEIGDKFDESKFSSFMSNDMDELKKHGVTYQMIEELVTLCTERALKNLKKRMSTDTKDKKRKSAHVDNE